MISFLIVFLFFTFYLACLEWSRYIRGTCTAFFILFSILLRLTVNFSLNADYIAYLQVANIDSLASNTNVSAIIFSEPYFFYGIKFVGVFLKSPATTLQLFYWLNLIFSSIFFLWIAKLRDIALWRKMVLFSFYYFFFTYTTIRNTPAYLLIAVLFYHLQRNRSFKIGYLSFLAHISALPVLCFSLLGVKKPRFSLIIIVLLMPSLILALVHVPALNLIDRYTVYTDGNEHTKSINHVIYLVLILFLTTIVFIYNRKYVFNNVYLLSFSFYLFSFLVNPVIAFRFSVYLILFLIVFPKTKSNDKVDFYFNNLSSLMLFILFSNFKSTHPTW